MSDLAYLTLGVTQTVGIFTALLPDVWAVREHDVNDDFAPKVRTAEGVALVLTLGIGLVASVHFRDTTPLLYSGLTGAAMIGLYEYLLRTSAPSTLAQEASA